MIRDYIRGDLKEYTPYHAPEKKYTIKMDANENPYLHDEMIINAMKQWIKDSDNIKRYPDTDCTQLRESIAKHWYVQKDNVVCGVGSDQLIDCILKVFLEPGDKVLMPAPSFSMYKLSTTLNHGKAVEYRLNNDFSYDIDRIISLYENENPKCVFLCTPNNPTGNIISVDDIEKLLQVIKCPVIVDEAYGEFVDETMINKIDKYDNIVVLRTFSKAYGLAGLRVGYGIGSKEMINAISASIPPYNLSAFSQFFAKYVIDNFHYYNDYVEKIKEDRRWLTKELSKLDFIEKVYPSHANYILVKVSKAELPKILEEKGILVRGYGSEGDLAHCIRITIGTTEENKELINIMNQL